MRKYELSTRRSSGQSPRKSLATKAPDSLRREQDIEEQLESLSSERFTMEQIKADAAISVMNLAKTWLDADLARRQELQNALFPEGLRFSN